MPATPSRRLGLHAPSGGDPADVPADVRRLRDQLDESVLTYAQGTLAARPASASGKEGRQYYATDKGTLFYDTGFGWVPYAWQPGDIRWTAAPGPFLGWAKCEARTVLDRELYEALFNAIRTTYGAGDGVRTFNVPDLSGRAAIGAGSGTGLTTRAPGSRGGAENHTLTLNEIPWHNHGINDGLLGFGPAPHDASVEAGAGGTQNFDFDYIYPAPAGGGATHNNMPPYVALHAWIKF
ncbi:tail fiber protein [Conexibacter stalactiti]|uniref:Tail fiber protein n=1 Tax=Conexibacter stalactiti TaxID=1940611 RepID=A0ABU4HWF1_9ACTN|nr:tail fiber protein [Conexibacter stalactiti]MDW5597651.1 tail fiber protein [Conexibacter stalactiti]MEC5038293.1 tail fiber protein [Conexibacter stalactiti]